LLFVIGAHPLPPEIAAGGEFANRPADLATVGSANNGQDSKLIEITPNQLQFLRGLYAMNLEAPRGLPPGDNAVLAHDSGDSGGLLFFIDGDKPCAPMRAPPALLSLMEKVAMADYRSTL
jgi:hypothetical protein